MTTIKRRIPGYEQGCSECGGTVRMAHGLCDTHYGRAKRRGELTRRNYSSAIDHAEWFWSQTDQSGGEDACWEWQRGRNRNGYGVANGGNHRQELAHRVAYRLAGGVLEDGQEILHSCDNRACCNTKHMRAGTHEENMADMVERGRGWWQQ